MHKSGAIAVGIEQCRQGDLRPQRGLADAGFEDRMVLRIEQRDGERADVLECDLYALLVGFADGQGEFEPGHWRHVARAAASVSSSRRKPEPSVFAA